MSTRYPGGFINRSAPVIVGPVAGEGGSAPGVWTLEQASYYTKQGTWPQKIKDKPLFSWGNNGYGQLGQNDIVYRSSPVQVGSLTSWSKVVAGEYASFFISTSGGIWSCGYNTDGRLGLSDRVYRSSPTQIGALTDWSLLASRDATIAAKTNGTLWSWGNNQSGQLGQNVSINIKRSSPVQIGSLTTWGRSIASGQSHIATVKTDGTLWTWGANNYGNLGQNDTVARSSPTQVGSQTDWSSVTCGWYTVIAIKTTGTLWSWGSGSNSGLGQNDTNINRSSPIQIGALTNWSAASSSAYDTVVIKTDGTLWVWGSNAYGELGKNNANEYSSPVQVGSLNSWSKASMGNYQMLAIKTDKTLWTCGQNDNGQLGQNNKVNLSSPTQVGSLNTWFTVSGGYKSVAALQAV